MFCRMHRAITAELLLVVEMPRRSRTTDRGTLHPEGLNRPALSHRVDAHHACDLFTGPGRAHHFREATSLSTWFCRLRSATIVLSCAFSRSNSFSRFASSEVINPYLCRHR